MRREVVVVDGFNVEKVIVRLDHAQGVDLKLTDIAVKLCDPCSTVDNR